MTTTDSRSERRRSFAHSNNDDWSGRILFFTAFSQVHLYNCILHIDNSPLSIWEETLVHHQLQLREVEELQNAGRYKQSLAAAQSVADSTDGHLRGMALSKVAMALADDRQIEAACETFAQSIRELEGTETPDPITLAVVTREYELHCAQHVPTPYFSDDGCQKRLTKRIEVLQALEQTSEVILEITMTRAFAHRAEMLNYGDTLLRREQLRSDAEDIKALRGNARPEYELDALLWHLRYDRPTRPNAYVWRAAALSTQLGMSAQPAKLGIEMLLNGATKTFSRMFG